jgi:Leucine-rich repeat (LRR) protein
LEEVFPNLIDFRIQDSDIPILRNNLFGPHFKWILYLCLEYNGIQIIEENAFAELKDLAVVDLSQNKLRSLRRKTFHNNPKLYRIDLRDNQINVIEPQTFKDLNQLKLVYASGNECADQTECLITYFVNNCDLDKLLGRCYENYDKALKSLKQGIIIWSTNCDFGP